MPARTVSADHYEHVDIGERNTGSGAEVTGVCIAAEGPSVYGSNFNVRDRHGNTPDAPTARPLSTIDFTLTITGQDGPRFWGTIGSAALTEPVIGVFASETSFVFVDDDGTARGDLRAPDRIVMTYTRSGETLIAARTELTRKP